MVCDTDRDAGHHIASCQSCTLMFRYIPPEVYSTGGVRLRSVTVLVFRFFGTRMYPFVLHDQILL